MLVVGPSAPRVPVFPGKDFDILVGGHLTRLGTKADVQRAVDFFVDVVAGGEAGNAAVTFPDVIAGTGVTDPTNPNFGNTWCAVLIIRFVW